jgi:serine/threonine protein kinase
MKPPEVVTLDFFGRRKYVVARVLQGGMGSVYRLVPIDTANRTVALKTIKGASSIRGFEAECEAGFSLAHHPNIARALTSPGGA